MAAAFQIETQICPSLRCTVQATLANLENFARSL